MKNIILTVACLLFAFGLIAQQEQQYTQFMLNKLTFNPAYAGSSVSPKLTAIYRNQWLGLEGAPESQLLSFNKALLNERVGFGATLSRNTVGINRRVTADIAYSYRFMLPTGILSVGLQASMRHLRQDWTDDRLNGAQLLSTDDAIPMEPLNKLLPNFGAGVFYQNEDYYIGVSLPRMVANSIDDVNLGGNISRESRHYFFMGGYSFQPSETVELTPQILVNVTEGQPLEADFNVTAEWNKKLMGGLTYRTGSGKTAAAGESIDIMSGIQINPSLFFALSYDISLTKLRNYSNGSLEAVARYIINPEPESTEVRDPRRF